MNRYPHKNPSNKQPPTDTRYEQAKKEVDDRHGAQLVRTANWRLFALLSIGINGLLTVGITVIALQHETTPYLIEVTTQGAVRNVGKLQAQAWDLNKSAKHKVLSEWVVALRSVPTDKRVLLGRQTYLRTHSTDVANMKLDAFLSEHDLFADYGTLERSIAISSINDVGSSPDVYRVEWVEQEFESSGRSRSTTTWVGEFHLMIIPPPNEQQLQANPLGVFVNSFDATSKSTSTN